MPRRSPVPVGHPKKLVARPKPAPEAPKDLTPMQEAQARVQAAQHVYEARYQAILDKRKDLTPLEAAKDEAHAEVVQAQKALLDLRDNALRALLADQPFILDPLAPPHTCHDKQDALWATDDCPRCALLQAQRCGWFNFAWEFTTKGSSD